MLFCKAGEKKIYYISFFFLKFHLALGAKLQTELRSDFNAISDIFSRDRGCEFSIKTLIVSTQLLLNQ